MTTDSTDPVAAPLTDDTPAAAALAVATPPDDAGGVAPASQKESPAAEAEPQSGDTAVTAAAADVTIEAADAPAERPAAELSEADHDAEEEVDAAAPEAPLSRKDRLLAGLAHKRTLIIAGAAITPVIIGAIAYALMAHVPEKAHDAPANADMASAAPIKPITPATPAAEHGEHPPAEAPATSTPPAAPSHAGTDHAPAAQDAATQTEHAQAPATEPPRTAEQQATELAATQKLLTEERAKRLAAERRLEGMRVAEAPLPAFTREKTPRAGAGGGGKPGSRRLEDCNVQGSSFAETLKACIEEFNRMPQSR